jgi:hypothetical protein
MLIAETVDDRTVFHRPLAFISFACCALVVASFGFFATDQLAGASRHQQNELLPSGRTVSAPRGAHAEPRAFIDSAAAKLTRPYEGFTSSRSAWLERGLPTVIALIVYGFGIGAIVRYLRR